MDSITHGLVAAMVFQSLYPGGPVLFAVLGAVLPDTDIFQKWISDRDPRLFIFCHGGFSHSIAGSAAIAVAVVAGFQGWQVLAGKGYAGAPLLLIAWALAWGGALSHIALDFLAFPGIPLLYPATPRKFSAGIFPGPSLVLFATSLGFVMAFFAGNLGITALYAYGAFIMAVIAAHGILKVVVAAHYRGTTIPTFNPLKWLVIRESGDSYEVYAAGLSKRRETLAVYHRHDGVGPGFISRHSGDPEVQRLAYHSYVTVAGREDGTVVIRDPIRESGLLPYPPYYKRVRITGEEEVAH